GSEVRLPSHATTGSIGDSFARATAARSRPGATPYRFAQSRRFVKPDPGVDLRLIAAIARFSRRPIIEKRALNWGIFLRRVSEPAEVGGTARYVASDASSYTTGAVLEV